MNFQIIILAAGKGTRMGSALPKVLVGLKGKPLIQHLLDNTKNIKTTHPPIIVIGHKYELIQSYLGQNFIYAFQEGQLGTGHAVAAALPKVSAQNVLVLYGDMPFVSAKTLEQLNQLHIQSNSKFSMLTTTVPNFDQKMSSLQGFGRIIRDSHGQLLKIQEFVDASEAEKKIKEVNPAIYLFDTKWLSDHIGIISKNKHGEYYLTDLVEIAAKQGLKITTASVEPLEVFGINTPQQLEQAEKF